MPNQKNKKVNNFKTAKENFNIFVFNNQRLLETNKKESEQKMVTLESIKVSFAILWTLFYLAIAIVLMYFAVSDKFPDFPKFWGSFSLLYFICSLFYNISKYSKRNNYKDVALMRLQMKINKYVQYDTPQKAIIIQEKEQGSKDEAKNNTPIQSSPVKVAPVQKPVVKAAPIKRQLDFNNLTKEKISQILQLSNISFSPKDTIDKLALKANSDDNIIKWNKISKELLKEILDLNGITYKLNISKEDMVKLLDN